MKSITLALSALCLSLVSCTTPSTQERTVSLAETQKEIARPNSKCTLQLELGYVLKEEIDGEYWIATRDETFQDRREEFMAKWDSEVEEWTTKTNAVLLQIGGPTASGRFQNAMIPTTVLDNTNMKWNGIRNSLQGRLVALESICKKP
jgi:hypothetical protein